MTYKIQISRDEYQNWAGYVNFDTESTSPLSPFIRRFMEYPEITNVSDLEIDTILGLHRTFEFISEQHYHWFLLQQ